jgi:ATP-dependent DNA helicase RecG
LAVDIRRIEAGENLTTDGEQYEEVRSLNQDLTFKEAGDFFAMQNVPFGPKQQKTLRLQTPGGVYTNLGLLLSDQAVHTVKMAVFEGLEKEVFKERREISGSLFRQLEETYSLLDIFNHTHAEVKGLIRLEKQDYPEEALREALLNALVHRDYAFSASTLISVFDDRIEFVSIGGLTKGVTLDDIMLGLSMPRNENLANIFYRLRLIEAYGTGIPKIMRSYAACSKKPELQATNNAFKITLPNRNLRRPGDTGKEGAGFSENETKILALWENRDEIVRKDVETALAVSQAMAVRLLRGLADKGSIRVIGGGKKTRYRKQTATAAALTSFG